MRQYTAPVRVQIDDDASCSDIIWDNAHSHPDHVIIGRTLDGQKNLTAKEFADLVGAVAKGLMASGIKAGDRIGLMSRTRFEWTLFDLAIWATGAVTVPIYDTSSAEQVQWILSDSGAKACIVETVAHAAMVDAVRPQLPTLRHVWQIDTDPGAEKTLIAAGSVISDSKLDTRRQAVKADDVATIIYTSGTTGRPKGCALTHRNFLSGAQNALTYFAHIINPSSRVLFFLPLAHVFAREVQMCVLFAHSLMGFCPNPKDDLLASAATFKPTFTLAVPRVFEKIYNGAHHKAYSSGKGGIFTAAERVAVAYSEAQEKGSPGVFLRIAHKLFERLVYRKIRAVLGGDAVGAISGGAPLGTRLAHFFRGVGITLFEGYGLTETTAAATVNRPGEIRIGTVGRPIGGTTIAIADDGEVIVAGPIIVRNYWNDPASTDAALDEGWFHTGDLGNLDKDGYLTITGRKKEMLVTASGKNVAPAPLEDRLRAHPLISQCLVIGDRKPYIACLITLDPEAMETWKKDHHKTESLSAKEMKKDPDLLVAIQQAVDEANKGVSHAEAIKVFRILDEDFTIENELLTPSMKVKRTVVAERFASDITAIYGS